jgi:hypothetical protein
MTPNRRESIVGLASAMPAMSSRAAAQARGRAHPLAITLRAVRLQRLAARSSAACGATSRGTLG